MDITKLFDNKTIKKSFNDMNDTFEYLKNNVNIDDYIEKIAKNACVFVIMKDGHCIAFSAVYINDYQSKIAYITLIGVNPNHRNNGLGHQLLSFCELQAKNRGMDFIQLEVKKNNHNARSLYEKSGYHYLKRESEQSYYMEKRLNS